MDPRRLYAGYQLAKTIYSNLSPDTKRVLKRKALALAGRAAKRIATAAAVPVAAHLTQRYRNSNSGTSMPRNARVSRGRRIPRKPYKSRRSRKHRRKRLVSRKPKKAPFSSKGFVIYDKEKYQLSSNPPLEGHSTAETFWKKHAAPWISDTTAGGTPAPYGLGDPTGTRYCYSRFRVYLDSFNTVAGISKNFNKYHVDWVKIVFRFPDQAASATNTQYPTKMFVNYGDMYRCSWDADNNIGSDNPVPATTPALTQMMERPGWKEFNIKRMNKLTIKFKPTMVEDYEEFNKNGIGRDQMGVKKQRKWMEIGDSGRLTTLLGPTIVFRGVTGATAVGASQGQIIIDYDSYLAYTTAEVTAKIAFKDRNQQADD